jgi:hypothetical protein
MKYGMVDRLLVHVIRLGYTFLLDELAREEKHKEINIAICYCIEIDDIVSFEVLLPHITDVNCLPLLHPIDDVDTLLKLAEKYCRTMMCKLLIDRGAGAN